MQMNQPLKRIETRWHECIKRTPDYAASNLFEQWRDRVVKTILAGFRRPDMAHVPPEYVELQLTVDSQSLEHLWVRSMCRDGDEMDLGRVRHLMDIMLTERSSMRLSSVEYEEWLDDLLKFLNADSHDGSVRKESFLTLFGLWFSSRLWFIPRNRSPIERILLTWE